MRRVGRKLQHGWAVVIVLRMGMGVGVRVAQRVWWEMRVAPLPVSRVQQFPCRAHVRDERYVVLRVCVFPWSSVASSDVHPDAHSAAAMDFGEDGF